MQKRWYFPNKENLFFQSQKDETKLSVGGQELRTSTSIRQRPIRGEGHIDFLGESEGSLPPPHDSFPDAGEAMNDFWSMSGNFIYRHHVEPRVKLHSPREESFPIPLKYIDVSRTTRTNLDVKRERRIDDYGIIDGSRDLSGSLTGFTQFTFLEEKSPHGYMWSGERLTRKQLTSRPDHLWPELWIQIGKKGQAEGEAKSGPMKNRNSIMPENHEELISLTLITRKSKKPSRMLERNWKHQWLLLCFARQPRNVNPMRSNQNLRVFWKPVNAQDCVWENLYRIIMRTMLQEKETIHYSIIIWYTGFSKTSSHEDSRSKSSSG